MSEFIQLSSFLTEGLPEPSERATTRSYCLADGLDPSDECNDCSDCTDCTDCNDCSDCSDCSDSVIDVGDAVSISVSNITSSSVKLTMGAVTNASWYYVAYRKSSSTSTTYVTTTSRYYTISGLDAGTKYVVNYRGENSTDVGSFLSTGVYFTTGSSIDEWSWTSSNGFASSAQTQAAHSALTNGTSISNFSYLVWNDLIDKIYEACLAEGSSWWTEYSSYENAKMTSTDKTLTATRFNSMKYNIGARYSTGISDVSTGDPVIGDDFLTIVSSLNSWIATI